MTLNAVIALILHFFTEARGDSCSPSESRYCHCLLFFYFLIKSVSPFIVLLTFFSGQNLILWYSITALTSDTNSFSRRSIRLSGNCKPAWLNRLFAFPFTYPLFLHLDNFAVVRLLKKFRIFLIICVISCSSGRLFTIARKMTQIIRNMRNFFNNLTTAKLSRCRKSRNFLDNT